MKKTIGLLMAAVCAGAAAFSAQVSFDSRSVIIDGKRQFLVSGEFHYFRVPKSDWRRRLELLKATGANCVATYIPWCVHEPEDGVILFGDRPERDLDGFLKTVKEAGLMAIVRPGPYQYSELVYAGLPRWLVEGHPEIRLKKSDGSAMPPNSADYNHPYFLERTRKYFGAVAKVLKPHLASNGGAVVMIQLDNELTGIHVWSGYEATPEYYEKSAEFLATLKSYLVAEGLEGPWSHNLGGPTMSIVNEKISERMGNKDFILGYDHYYGLFQSYVESPTPYFLFNTLFACDQLNQYGYPPVGFEIQCGTIGDIPPILKEDLLACYMLNLASGAKGINYYVFTGGPNFPGTGESCDIYDYSAPVGPTGDVRRTYGALKEFGEFLGAHPELCPAERVTSVRVGSETAHHQNAAPFDMGFYFWGMYYSLMQTPYHPRHFILSEPVPLDGKPLVLPGITSMSAKAQRLVADYVAAGGTLLVAPDFPRQDTDGKPCTILADAVGAPCARPAKRDGWKDPFVWIEGVKLYGISPKFEIGPEGTEGTSPYCRRWTSGKGRVTQLGATWKTQRFSEDELVERLVASLGAKPVVRSSNRNVFTTAFRLESGKLGVFALNLRSGAQETEISAGDAPPKKLEIPAMRVEYVEVDAEK